MFDANPAPAPDLRTIAFYLPQFHPIPENDVFWGKGFTEWHNVVRARPRFRGHDQPHLPADLGFYDLRLAETRIAQATLARNAGLSGFCYYHYWFSGRRLLERPFEAVLASGEPDFPFMLCWANENWTRAWNGSARKVLLTQTYSDDDTRAHARSLAPAFADPRYIRIDGRPVFAIYNSDQIPCSRAWTDLFRETSLNLGFEPYLIRVERYRDRDLSPPAALGFDAALEFQPFSRNFLRWQRARPDLKRSLARRLGNRLHRDWKRVQPWRQFDTCHDMAAFCAYDICQDPPDYTHFPGVCPSWDNSARRPDGQAIIFRNSSPDLFANWLAAKTRAFRPPSAQENLVFVNAWNEWAEGNHLEPSNRHGHRWLTALQQVLTMPAEEARSPLFEAR